MSCFPISVLTKTLLLIAIDLHVPKEEMVLPLGRVKRDDWIGSFLQAPVGAEE